MSVATIVGKLLADKPIYIVHDIVNIVVELFVEAHELLREVSRYRKCAPVEKIV